MAKTVARWLILGLGLACVAVALGHDLVRGGGGPGGFGLQQELVLLAGILIAAEGWAEIRSGQAPALWWMLRMPGGLATAGSLALASGVGLTLLFIFRSYYVDDAFITFRFARNLAHGLGIVWNPGEPAVEGYSNFSWLLLAAGAIGLDLDPLGVAKVAGWALSLASVVLVYRLARTVTADPAQGRVAALLFACTPAFAFWAGSGLETGLAVALALAFLLATHQELERHGVPWRSGAAAIGLMLTRPEGLFVAGLGILPLLWRASRERWAWLVRLAAIVVPAAAAYLLWKQHTFGSIVANTAAAKWRPMQGLPITSDFVLFCTPILISWLFVRRREASLLEAQILCMAGGMALVSLNIAPQVAHYLRFFLPVLAPLYALVRIPQLRVAAGEGERNLRGFAATLLWAVALMVPLLRMVNYATLEVEGYRQAHIPVAKFVKLRFAPQQLLAASDCGLIPYLTGMRTLDIWGLTDRRIAHSGFSVDYVMDQNPAVIVLHSMEESRFVGREAYDTLLGARVGRGNDYWLAGRWPFYGYWLWVYERRGA